MLSVDDAVVRLTAAGAARAAGLAQERVPVIGALGRVLAEDIVAEVDVPPRDNSAMDGYAFSYRDAEAANFSLPLSQRIPAGSAPPPLQPGTAARIFTGAELPEGADTVAMQEDCQAADGEVRIDPRQLAAGDNVRACGQDIHRGQLILVRGAVLRPQELGLLYSVGMAEVAVHRRLKVAVFSTGDELVEAGTELRPGQIYNSNRATLWGLLSAWGAEVIDLGIVPDDAAATVAALARGAAAADLVVTSGGVSAGEEDHVKAAAEQLGTLEFWKIAVKPGKPLAFGHLGGALFAGLPGNPASVFVTAMLFLRPLLLSAQGRAQCLPRASLETSLFARAPVRRQEYLRARRGADGVEIFPNQSSGVLSSACWGDGLVVQKPGRAIAIGEKVSFYSYSELLSS